MQRGMKGAQGVHIQASGNIDLYMEHPKRKQSCSEPGLCMLVDIIDPYTL